MPLSRFEQLPEGRRRAILDAAASELREHGSQGASLNRVLERAEISKGVLYYYFADRQDLMSTALRVHLERLLEVMGWPEPVATADAYWQDWESRYGRMITALAADENLAGIMRMSVRARTGAIEVPISEFSAMVDAWLARMLEVGRQVGAVREDLPADLVHHVAFGVLEGEDRWLDEHWDGLSGDERSDLPASLIDLLRRVIEPEPHRHSVDPEEEGS